MKKCTRTYVVFVFLFPFVKIFFFLQLFHSWNTWNISPLPCSFSRMNRNTWFVWSVALLHSNKIAFDIVYTRRNYRKQLWCRRLWRRQYRRRRGCRQRQRQQFVIINLCEVDWVQIIVNNREATTKHAVEWHMCYFKSVKIFHVKYLHYRNRKKKK